MKAVWTRRCKFKRIENHMPEDAGVIGKHFGQSNLYGRFIPVAPDQIPHRFTQQIVRSVYVKGMQMLQALSQGRTLQCVALGQIAFCSYRT